MDECEEFMDVDEIFDDDEEFPCFENPAGVALSKSANTPVERKEAKPKDGETISCLKVSKEKSPLKNSRRSRKSRSKSRSRRSDSKSRSNHHDYRGKRTRRSRSRTKRSSSRSRRSSKSTNRKRSRSHSKSRKSCNISTSASKKTESKPNPESSPKNINCTPNEASNSTQLENVCESQDVVADPKDKVVENVGGSINSPISQDPEERYEKNTSNEETTDKNDDIKSSEKLKPKKRSRSRSRKNSSRYSDKRKSGRRSKSRPIRMSGFRMALDSSKKNEEKRKKKRSSSSSSSSSSGSPFQSAKTPNSSKRRRLNSPFSTRQRHTGSRETPHPSTSIVLFGLPMTFKEFDLANLIPNQQDDLPSPTSASIAMDKRNGISRGFGFLNFETVESASSAMNYLNTSCDLVTSSVEITCKFSVTKRATHQLPTTIWAARKR